MNREFYKRVLRKKRYRKAKHDCRIKSHPFSGALKIHRPLMFLYAVLWMITPPPPRAPILYTYNYHPYTRAHFHNWTFLSARSWREGIEKRSECIIKLLALNPLARHSWRVICMLQQAYHLATYAKNFAAYIADVREPHFIRLPVVVPRRYIFATILPYRVIITLRIFYQRRSLTSTNM